MCDWNGWTWVGEAHSMMWLGMLIVWGLPLALLLALVFSLARNRGGVPHRENAIDILDKAYARGDISREEYLQKRADLQRERPIN